MSGKRRGYKTAFFTKHVLWTDGGELCIKAFTLLMYFYTRVKMSLHVEQNVKLSFHILTQEAFYKH